MSEPITTIGKILTDEPQRDAIHMAIAPVVAACNLEPGEHVGVNDKGEADPSAEHIGIVDPFLRAPVKQRERCWLFLYPNTITSLRHDWSHPAFEPKALDQEQEAAWKWMREFAAQHYSHRDEYYDGMGRYYTAEEVIGLANDFLLSGDRHVQQGSESLRDYTIPEEFWPRFEAITGVKVADYHRDQVPFCCTC